MKPFIPSDIIDQLKKIKNCQAILLMGSRAIGKETENSDWDFYIILKDGSKSWRKAWKYKNTWIEIFCVDSKTMKSDFAKDLIEGRGLVTYMLATGYIVLDSPRKTLINLTKIAKKNWNKGPNKLTQSELNWINFDISTYLQNIEDCISKNNPAHTVFNQAYNDFIRYYYRLNNVWIPRPKKCLYDLKVNHKKMYQYIEAINKQNNWKNKAKLLLKLGKFIGKKFKLSLTGELEVRHTKY